MKDGNPITKNDKDSNGTMDCCLGASQVGILEKKLISKPSKIIFFLEGVAFLARFDVNVNRRFQTSKSFVLYTLHLSVDRFC